MNLSIPFLAGLFVVAVVALAAGDPPVRAAERVEANCVAEIALLSEKTYRNPFIEAQLEAIVTQPDGTKVRVPGFWAGGNRWCFRYASSEVGQVAWRTECSDRTNPRLHGVEGKL